MLPKIYPLRWQSTKDQWWYVSPIECAAANGHYELVRQLLHIDANHLIKLTSLRRIRRLETVWDDRQDHQHFHHIAKCRSDVAQKLLIESEAGNRNSLVKTGYGGWLLYTAASAGDLEFVQELLERDPLLVFGEGEYGVTDILYGAARSGNCQVFRMIFDFAMLPRGKGGDVQGRIGEVSSGYRWQMINRSLHAAARGGNLVMLKEFLNDCGDVFGYRDVHGSTILHSAAGKGQVEVVRYLYEAFGILDSMDNYGNTPLHIAAYKGQLASVLALISLSPTLINSRNKWGEILLHTAVSGLQSPDFQILGQQVEFFKGLMLAIQELDIKGLMNAKTNKGATALHMAIQGSLHLKLVEVLLSVPSLDVNELNDNGMTALDLLRKQPRSASKDILTRRLIAAGGMFCNSEFVNHRVSGSVEKVMQGNEGSPGTSFRIPDNEIFLHTGIKVEAKPGRHSTASSSSSLMKQVRTMAKTSGGIMLHSN